MIRNFFKVAVRNMWKQKGYSFLNIFGLAMGMACSLLIILWVQHERQVDAFHVNGPYLYAVYEQQFYDHKKEGGYYTPGVLSDEMRRVIPEIRYSSGFAWTNLSTFSAGNKIIRKENNYASTDFFRMFSFPLLRGSAQTALATPVSMAISHSMANEFFGSPAAAIGKTIRYQDKKDYTVTAVFEDISDNSSMKFDCLINWHAFLEDNAWAKEWGNNGPSTFIQLRPDANAELVDQKIRRFLDKYNKEQNDKFRIHLRLQLFGDRYLHSSFKGGEIMGGRIGYVRLFSIIAVFILLIACINFMNLTTARSVKRSKEIGVRKVIGAVRPALIRQFMGEAILLTFFAVLVALLMVLLLLPGFNHLTGEHTRFPAGSLSFWGLLAGLTIVTGCISGSYPALLLSSFQPIRILKGTLKFSNAAGLFRKGLVIFQFTLSTVLIIGTIVISRQVHYVQTVNLGFDRENLIYIPLEGQLSEKFQVFRDRAFAMPGISNITLISQTPTSIENGSGGVDWDGKDPNTLPMFTQAAVGYDFVKTMKLKLVQGRDFSKDYVSDSVAYIVNETALKRIAYKDPIGKRLTFWGKKGTIIGVLKDFHFNSLHEPIQPLIIRPIGDHPYGSAMVRTEAGKTKQAIASLEKVCKEVNPKFPFSYQFSDEEYHKLYKSEQVMERLCNYFAFLAIFISCLGLLGLAMFTAEQRTREFGIRKVLGASISSLFALLSKDFLLLVLVAFLIASPLAWWSMQRWLQDFAYHIDVPWWIFIMAGGIALFIALLTISFQAMKVAVANPVRSLRTE